ncbi:serine aminopeptidase domain-containing protein [Croceicoccus sp. BE223]|uniref:alpha/beta hydrolase family protein n=1 Tax=Croceicoccus sp. BE223 TaxID=2817716 RepID=UPI00285E3901|nr:alpha/beta hydrolase [Croceicoccus sp. BE223]MDR7101141.1 hypothetical protein [Croceicoccus sp. BE223]
MTDRRAVLAGGAALVGAGLIGSARAAAGVRAPPATTPGPTATGAAGVLTIEAAPGRSMDVHVWGPAGEAGTILFSHGAASSPRFYDRVLRPWALAGYRVFAPLHVDSTEHPRTAEFAGLASWRARLEDMHALANMVRREGAGTAGWIAAGHSYGGLTALTLGGAGATAPDGFAGPLSRPEAACVIALSPPAPIPVLITQEGYGQLRVPAMVQTGTLDIVPGITATDGEGWRSHLAAFEAPAPGGDRFGLVLEGVDHYFGGAICRHDLPGPMQLDRLADFNSLSVLFARGFGPAGQDDARRDLRDRVADRGAVRLSTR